MLVSIALAVVTLTGLGDAPGRLRPGGGRRAGARLRRAGSPDAHVPDGRPEGAAERRRAQLRALQRLARDRPRHRGRRDRARRHRPLLRRQRRQLPLGAPLARADAGGGALSRREAPRDARPGGDPRGARLGVPRARRADRAHGDHRDQPRRLQLPRPRAAPRLADARRRGRDVRSPLRRVRAGALVGALATASLREATTTVFVGGAVGFSALMLLLSLVHTVGFALVLLFGLGAELRALHLERERARPAQRSRATCAGA